jgi:DNA-binding NarL/FixJ family response regulator
VIRVLIADDHPVFRRGLAGVLAEEADITVVGEACDGDEAVDVARAARPDVVLMDLSMGGRNGVEATRRLAEEVPEAAVLVLTMLDGDQWVHAALRAGAHGYLVKGSAGESIVGAVRAVAGGDAVLGRTVARRVLGVLADRPGRRTGPFPALTEREVEILDLVAAGLSNGQIARRLTLSDKTVRNHVSNVLTKLGVPDRSRAIVMAREAGLGSG